MGQPANGPQHGNWPVHQQEPSPFCPHLHRPLALIWEIKLGLITIPVASFLVLVEEVLNVIASPVEMTCAVTTPRFLLTRTIFS